MTDGAFNVAELAAEALAALAALAFCGTFLVLLIARR
jgi:hypothetical protein